MRRRCLIKLSRVWGGGNEGWQLMCRSERVLGVLKFEFGGLLCRMLLQQLSLKVRNTWMRVLVAEDEGRTGKMGNY